MFNLKGHTAVAPLLQAVQLAYPPKVAREGKKVWLVAQEEARYALMTGVKAQQPSGRAVRKAARRILKGLSIKGAWRSWPRIKESEHEV